MKYLFIYKKYFIYIALLVTLLATAYFKYQDFYHTNSIDVVGVADHPTRSVDIRKLPTESGRSLVDDLSSKARVDIFEIYKKAAPLAEAKENVRQKVVLKLNPIISVPPLEIQPPTAPKIPFKYIGKIWGDEEYQVFIEFNGKNLIIKEGDTIQQIYKVEKISPPTMTLTYLPMNILQSMPIGGA